MSGQGPLVVRFESVLGHLEVRVCITFGPPFHFSKIKAICDWVWDRHLSLYPFEGLFHDTPVWAKFYFAPMRGSAFRFSGAALEEQAMVLRVPSNLQINWFSDLGSVDSDRESGLSPQKPFLKCMTGYVCMWYEYVHMLCVFVLLMVQLMALKSSSVWSPGAHAHPESTTSMRLFYVYIMY